MGQDFSVPWAYITKISDRTQIPFRILVLLFSFLIFLFLFVYHKHTIRENQLWEHWLIIQTSSHKYIIPDQKRALKMPLWVQFLFLGMSRHLNSDITNI